MHSFVRLSPRCFPAKVWRNNNGNGFSQVSPDEHDIIRREALAAWQLGYCTLAEALQALERIEALERQLVENKRATLEQLAYEVTA